jgi:hypothetical protein
MPQALWKMPPMAKVYEALGAIGDGRVHIEDDRRAFVRSSDATKTYEVDVSGDGRGISSNDNASFWQGYLGYPSIATLIARGLIPRPDEAVMHALAGVPWKELNTKYRNDYDRTLEDVLARAAERGSDAATIRAAAASVLEAVRVLGPYQGPRRRPPRTSSKK